MARDTRTRQRLFRQRMAQAGHKRLTVYLPARSVTRIDSQVRVRGGGRDTVIAELVDRALSSAAVDTRWLSGLVDAIAALEQVTRLSRSQAVLTAVRTAHQQATTAYRTMPAELRSSEAAKKLAAWIGRMDVLLRS